MAFRFRRTITIAPGIRLNVGKTGITGLSIGPRGFSFTLGKGGAYANVGLPGTGLSYRTKLGGGWPTAASAPTPIPQGETQFALTLEKDGHVSYWDTAEKPLAAAQIERVKKENRASIEAWLAEQVEAYNAATAALLNLHHTTPAPDDELDRTDYERQGSHISAEQWAHITAAYDRALDHDREAMQDLLAAVLAVLIWPRETHISFELTADGETILLDVDLPEIEDLPHQTAVLNKRDLCVVFKERSANQLRRDYVQHIHAVGLRLIGEVFTCLPTVQTVVCAAFSQRVNTQTGHMGNEYLYSVRVGRGAWERLNFANLAQLNPVACFTQFELRRTLNANNYLKPIEPFVIQA